MFWMLLPFAALVFLTGCPIEDAGCASDDDCRFGRSCQEGFCVGDVTGNPNNVNNTNNLNNTNNVNNSNNSNNVNNTNNTNNTNNQNNSNNSNNVECFEDGDCGGGLLCQVGVCTNCTSNFQCNEDLACSNECAFEGDNCATCQETDDSCYLAAYDNEPGEFCSAVWVCAGTEYVSNCAYIDDDLLECSCFSTQEEEGNTVRFEIPVRACEEIDALESIINQECGARLRYTGLIDG